MRGRRLAALALLLLGAVSCGFDPVFPEGEISCRTERDCPPSYICRLSACYSIGAANDAGVIDAPMVADGASGRGGSGGRAGSSGSAGVAGSAGAGGGAGLGGGAGNVGVAGAAAAGAGGRAGTGGGPAGAAGSGIAGATGGSAAGAGGRGGSTGAAGSGATDGGADAGCGTTCTLGTKRCGTAGIQTCVMVGNCPAFGPDVDCPGRQTCQGAAPAAACTCPAAPAGCTGKGVVCAGGNARTCDVDAEGCSYEKSSETCTAGKPCAGTFPTAACTCPAAPAACMGSAGTRCASSNTQVITCGPNADGCLAMTNTTTCPTGKPCSVTGTTATCSCTGAPAECAAGAGGVCRTNGELATCGLDPSGCLVVTSAGGCPAGLTCQGAAGSATCRCPASPALCNGGTGQFCMNAGQLVTCGRDAAQCLKITSMMTCPGVQTCGGSAGTASCNCPALPAACPGGAGKLCSGNNLVNCVADAQSCVSVGSNVACGGGLVCSGGFPTAACVCPTAPAVCNGTTGTFCSGNATVSCSRDGNNCLVAASPVACMGSLVCGGTAGSASCRCPTAPAACMGAGAGNVCQSATSYVTCATDASGCVQITASNGTCPGGSKPCSGSPGSAACACNTTPNAACTPGGAFAAGYACSSGSQRVQCVVDGNGCNTSNPPATCPSPQTCQGTLPSAVCACPAGYNTIDCDANGEINGNRCVGSTLYTCTDAGGGCQQLSTTSCAANQLCVGSHPGARCADEEKKGVSTAGGMQQSWSAILLGMKINVPVSSTLRRLGVYWNGNGSGAALMRTLTFAVYRDGGSGPNGALLASAIDRTVNTLGAVDFNLTTPAGGTTLTAGDYWLFVEMSAAGYVAMNGSPTTSYLYLSHTYGSALPATVTPASFMSGQVPGPLALYMVVIPQQ